MSLSHVVRRTLRVLCTDGPLEVARRACDRVVARERMVLLRARLEPGMAPASRSDLQFVWLTPDSLATIGTAAYNFGPASLVEAQGWLARGDQCLIARVAGEPVTYLWITRSHREFHGLRVPVGPRRAFIYKTFTRADWRGRGLNQAALAAALAAAATHGDEVALIDVAESNTASLKAIRNAGFKPIARFAVWRVGSRRVTRLSGEAREAISGNRWKQD